MVRKRKRKRKLPPVRTGGAVRAFTQLIVWCAIFAAMGVSLLFARSTPLPHCAPSSVPGVVSGTRIDGPLVHRLREYFIVDGFGEKHSLARCHRSRCPVPYAILKEHDAGKPAHAEWCGPYLTLVALDGVPVYTQSPPTQTRIDDDARTARLVGRCCFLFLLLVALGGLGTGVRKFRLAKKMAHPRAP